MKSITALSRYWSKIIGDDTQYSMECRIFNAVSIFAVIASLLNGIISLVLGLTLYGLLMVPLIGILLLGYYLSRYKNRLDIAVGLFAIIFNLHCGGTYLFVGASGGVNLFTFIIIVFILTIVSPKKQFWIWIPMSLLFQLVLFSIEYFHPELVKTIYLDDKNKLLDLSQTFFEVIILMIAITLFMKKSYNREKQLANSRLLELENSNETKNKLFSIVAHDVKAPLASIENYLSLLNQVDIGTEERTDIEKNLLLSTRQTSEMLQNILSWSVNQMDGLPANLNSLLVRKTLENTIAFQQISAGQKSINLNLLAGDDIKVIADLDMLQLIVRNLLNNAIKFSLPGAKIDINVIDLNTQCLISIADDGIGIAEDEKPLIFSLKSKGTYGTHKEKGVGLGLKLAKEYTEVQKGNIWFESELGKGTTFFVSLPKDLN